MYSIYNRNMGKDKWSGDCGQIWQQNVKINGQSTVGWSYYEWKIGRDAVSRGWKKDWDGLHMWWGVVGFKNKSLWK